jgi:alanine racemase
MIEFSYNVNDVAVLVGQKSINNSPSHSVSQILTDSRKITDAQTSLFFALAGNKNPHQFIDEIYHKGVRSFVITDVDFDTNSYPDANFIWVKNSLEAMQMLVMHHREQFNYPVIGITGSNGKTIVKEWLYQLLSNRFQIVRSPKSYNSQMGVPLSVWQMTNQFNLGIFEAGISKPDEMRILADIIKPTIGVLTNIGAAHDEGFANRTDKLVEKLKLFNNSDVLILEAKNQHSSITAKQVFTWSFTSEANLRVVDQQIVEQNYTLLNAIYQNQVIKIIIPFINQASVENAVICWAVLLQLNIPQIEIEEAFLNLQTVKMRLELKKGINQSSIIDDSYNSDFISLDIALDFLNQQHQHQTKTLILSDIEQSGVEPEQLYQNVEQLIKNKGIDQFIGIGEQLCKHHYLFKSGSLFYQSTPDFITHFNKDFIENTTVLVKGARSFEFERISKILAQKIHDTQLEINLNAVVHNLNYYKSKLQPNIKLMAMVKAFAYGSGGDQIANLLQHNRVDYLAVAYTDEGYEIRKAGVKLPIMVLNPEIPSFDSIINYNLEPQIYSFRILKAFADELQKRKIKAYPIHIKLDTGMHRLGFMPDEMPELLEFVKANDVFKVKSIFSHLAASENDLHKEYTQQQISIFKDCAASVESALAYPILKHIANTSAITKWPNAQFDMVRLGIGLYGIESNEAERGSLQQVATLKTSISQIKDLKKGDSVGYGRSGMMQKDGRIATVKIGYADGFPRALGNGIGAMSINNQIVPTIGNICMDMTMLDITDANVNIGDDVIVFGESISVYQLANQLNTIPYEVITNISQRVKRVYYYE